MSTSNIIMSTMVHIVSTAYTSHVNYVLSHVNYTYKTCQLYIENMLISVLQLYQLHVRVVSTILHCILTTHRIMSIKIISHVNYV